MSETQETEDVSDSVDYEYRLYDFMADWCAPCKSQAPIVEDFAEDNPDVDVQEVDVDEETDKANQYSVSSIPTIVLLEVDENGEDGDIVERWVGVTQQDEIEDALDN